MLAHRGSAQTWPESSQTAADTPSRVSFGIDDREPSRPYVLILPGILGEQMWDRRIRQGIQQSSLACDVEIFDWTGGPWRMVSNIGGDADNVVVLTRLIRRFRSDHPHRPLFMIGHSGGCRMVVRVLEELQNQRLVDRAVLLSPGLQSKYDLTRALGATRQGIVAFHSPLDLPISGTLTFARGLTRLRLDASAATFGFEPPVDRRTGEPDFYKQQLVQHEYNLNMMSTGNIGGHFGWTVPQFVSQHIAPLLQQNR